MPTKPTKTKEATKPKADKKKAVKKKPEPIKLKRLDERVRHNFSQSELVDFARQLAKKYRTLRTIESEKKSIAAQYTSREKQVGIEIDEITSNVNDGFEMRKKPCIELKDYKGKIVYYFLADDILEGPDAIDPQIFGTADDLLAYLMTAEYEPAGERPLRPDEHQQELFDEPDPAADPSDGPPGATPEAKVETS